MEIYRCSRGENQKATIRGILTIEKLAKQLISVPKKWERQA
jgi:hypothetical protein